ASSSGSAGSETRASLRASGSPSASANATRRSLSASSRASTCSTGRSITNDGTPVPRLTSLATGPYGEAARRRRTRPHNPGPPGDPLWSPPAVSVPRNGARVGDARVPKVSRRGGSVELALRGFEAVAKDRLHRVSRAGDERFDIRLGLERREDIVRD